MRASSREGVDYADWTIFFASRLCHGLGEGLSLELPDEAGGRRLLVEPVGNVLIDRHGPEDLAIAVAQWAAFQLSIWHEIATWFGWSWNSNWLPSTTFSFALKGGSVKNNASERSD